MRPGQARLGHSDRLIPSLKAQTSAFGGGLEPILLSSLPVPVFASGMEILYEEEYSSRNTIN